MLTICMEFRRGILFVRLKGHLNKKTISKLNKKVTSVIEKTGINNVVFNLENLKSIDFKGISSLLYIYEMCRKNDGNSLVCGNNDNIKYKLKKTRLLNYIYEIPEELSAIKILNMR